MKAQFNTNVLLWDNNDKGLWLDDMGYQSEDCGVFYPINIDYINYNSGVMDGRVGINGIDYSFDLEGIFDEDHDFEENPLFYLVDLR
jgi:phosphatidylserine/phosphatidylglycerophosphate/cardiolipin synthase-like enzyme